MWWGRPAWPMLHLNHLSRTCRAEFGNENMWYVKTGCQSRVLQMLWAFILSFCLLRNLLSPGTLQKYNAAIAANLAGGGALAVSPAFRQKLLRFVRWGMHFEFREDDAVWLARLDTAAAGMQWGRYDCIRWLGLESPIEQFLIALQDSQQDSRCIEKEFLLCKQPYCRDNWYWAHCALSLINSSRLVPLVRIDRLQTQDSSYLDISLGEILPLWHSVCLQFVYSAVWDHSVRLMKVGKCSRLSFLCKDEVGDNRAHPLGVSLILAGSVLTNTFAKQPKEETALCINPQLSIAWRQCCRHFSWLHILLFPWHSICNENKVLQPSIVC